MLAAQLTSRLDLTMPLDPFDLPPLRQAIRIASGHQTITHF